MDTCNSNNNNDNNIKGREEHQAPTIDTMYTMRILIHVCMCVYIYILLHIYIYIYILYMCMYVGSVGMWYLKMKSIRPPR